MIAPTATQIVRAFKRNCPGVRLAAEEREELWRLINIAIESNRAEAARGALEARGRPPGIAIPT